MKLTELLRLAEAARDVTPADVLGTDRPNDALVRDLARTFQRLHPRLTARGAERAYERWVNRYVDDDTGATQLAFIRDTWDAVEQTLRADGALNR